MSRLRSLLMLTICAFLITPALAYGQRCVVDVVVLNRDRKVTGPISAECPPSRHSVPFGNWGAEFRYFDNPKLRDGYQFSGWKAEDGWLQWNSCTTEAKFRTSEYFNHHNGQVMTQVAAPNVVNVVESRRENDLAGPDGVTCKSWLEQIQIIEFGFESESVEHGSSKPIESTSEPIELRIYELDGRIPLIWLIPIINRIDSADHVATLSYDPIKVLFNVQGDSCDGEWSCRGESAWVSPTSGAEEVFARLKLVVKLSKGGAAEEQR